MILNGKVDSAGTMKGGAMPGSAKLSMLGIRSGIVSMKYFDKDEGSSDASW